MKKQNKYWTLEKCIKDAALYETRGKWQKHSCSSYSIAFRNGWLDQCCKHMVQVYRSRNYWTLENCKKDALQYHTKKEWNDKSTGYSTAYKKGWLDECCLHMDELQKPHRYWTLERCIENALKYKSRTEWQKNSYGSYNKAHRNGWLEQCCSHMLILGNDKLRFIYVYEFQDNHAYIGLTHDLYERDLGHHKNPKSIVYIHAKNTKQEIPKIKKLTNLLEINIAQIKEGEFEEIYRKNAWKTLNRVKTGALGFRPKVNQES